MSPRDRQLLRIVSYNILDGGGERLGAIGDTLARLDGDIVGICEAQDPAAIAALAARLGYEHMVAEANDGKNHVAILTREPVERLVNLAPMARAISRGAMELITRIGDRRLRFVVTHLHAGQHAGDEATRLKELSGLLDLLNETPMPTVLMGDLNSAAPYHPFHYHAASPRVQKRLADRGVHTLDHDVIRRLMEAEWTDTYLHARPGEHVHTFTTEFPATRFDYIWVTPDLREAIRDAGVENSGSTRTCSDHFPIWADLAQ